MLTSLLLLALHAASVGTVVAYAYTQVLIQPGHLLHRPFGWLRNKLTRVEIREEVADLPEEFVRAGHPAQQMRRTEIRHESFLLKPLGGCLLCTAGQASFWTAVLFGFAAGIYPETISQFLLITFHLFFSICLSIILTLLLQRLLQK